MIDLRTEQVVSLAEATQHLPNGRGGKKLHLTTVHRWASIGVLPPNKDDPRIILETIRVGGTRCTSIEAIQRFCEHLTGGQDAPIAPRTTSSRRHAAEKAERELSRAGI